MYLRFSYSLLASVDPMLGFLGITEMLVVAGLLPLPQNQSKLPSIYLGGKGSSTFSQAPNRHHLQLTPEMTPTR